VIGDFKRQTLGQICSPHRTLPVLSLPINRTRKLLASNNPTPYVVAYEFGGQPPVVLVNPRLAYFPIRVDSRNPRFISTVWPFAYVRIFKSFSISARTISTGVLTA
jgi:hypothetical protein